MLQTPYLVLLEGDKTHDISGPACKTGEGD